MRKLIYMMNTTLDGYIAARGDDLGWGTPSPELHQWFNDRARELGVSLYGRKLWELMSAHWPTADQQPDATPVEVDFARVWQKTPKVVFSSTLTEVTGNARLVTGDAVAEISRLKAEDGAPMEIGGATLAGAAMRAGLIDEYQVVDAPGAGRRRHAVLQRAGHVGEPAPRGDENLPGRRDPVPLRSQALTCSGGSSTGGRTPRWTERPLTPDISAENARLVHPRVRMRVGSRPSTLMPRCG